jgi:large conductance mechanosensitive channel
VVDLAVGVIIGAAFGGLVKSLVDDVLMPPLGWLTGGLDFADKAIVIQKAGEQHMITGKELAKDVVFSYGKFINAIIQFLIVAIAIFLVIKFINAARKRFEKEQAMAPAAPAPPDVQLLTEIRDILKVK